MNRVFTLIDKLAYGLFIVGVLGGIAMAALIFVSTMLRYLIGSPISYSDELAGLLFFSMAFLSLPHVLNKGRHIRIDLLTNALPAPLRRLSEAFSGLVLIAFASIFFYESWDFMSFSMEIDAHSDISNLLLWPWMALMPTAMGLCILIQLRRAFDPAQLAMSEATHEEPL